MRADAPRSVPDAMSTPSRTIVGCSLPLWNAAGVPGSCGVGRCEKKLDAGFPGVLVLPAAAAAAAIARRCRDGPDGCGCPAFARPVCAGWDVVAPPAAAGVSTVRGSTPPPLCATAAARFAFFASFAAFACACFAADFAALSPAGAGADAGADAGVGGVDIVPTRRFGRFVVGLCGRVRMSLPFSFGRWGEAIGLR